MEIVLRVVRAIIIIFLRRKKLKLSVGISSFSLENNRRKTREKRWKSEETLH